MRALLPLIFVACGTAAKPPSAAPARLAGPRPGPATCTDVKGHSVSAMDDALRRYGKIRSLSQSGDDRDLKTAIDLFQRLALDYPWFSLAQRGLGIVYGFRGNWLGAYSAYVRYLTFPLHSADREKTAAELRLLEQKQPALKAYAEAMRYHRDREDAKATELLRKVIGQKPQFALAHRALGLSLAQAGKMNDASDALEAYLRLEPLAGDRREVESDIERYRSRR